jgi:hypothetical protein
VLCVGTALPWEQLLCDLLVQALRDEGIESRSESRGPSAPAGPSPAGETVSTILLNCPLDEDLESWQLAVRELRAAHPRAMLLALELAAAGAVARDAAIAGQVDLVVRSFPEGRRSCWPAAWRSPSVRLCSAAHGDARDKRLPCTLSTGSSL